MAVETFIGWRYLKAKRSQAFISVITLFSLAGIALGVTTLIVVLAVMSGTEAEMKRRILGVNSHILVLRYAEPLDDYAKTMKEVERVPGVAEVSPFVYGQVIMSGRGGVSGAMLRGIDPDRTSLNQSSASMVASGRLEDLRREDGRPPGILLGKELAAKLRVEPGDMVRVVSPEGDVSDLGRTAPRVRRFVLVGLIDTGMHDFDTTLAYIDLHEAQDFLGFGGSVSGLEVKVTDIYQAPAIRREIMLRLGVDYWARDWTQMNRNLFAALQLQKTAMFIILSLTVLVAAFNMASTLIMVVMEKTRDIAILKSMGATRRSIMKIFIFQGLIIGGAGTLIGLCGGIVVCQLLQRYQFIELPNDVYYLSTLPARMEPMDVGLVLASALLISFLATLYPAWQASRLAPVDALRYE